MIQKSNSLNKIIEGIKACVRNNIRVSVNMVITRSNKNQVYETGKFAAELGATKFF